MENKKEFKKLEKENRKIREGILILIGDNPLCYKIVEQINELVENEIEQEKLCGE